MDEIKTQSGRRHDALVRQQVVIEKIQSGAYPTEETDCFCGAKGGIEIRNVDRNRIPHRIVVCETCALMRANPRLTKEAYTEFYNSDYRYVNPLSWPADNNNQTDDELYAQLADEKGQKLIAWLDDWEVDFPKIVVDWGCHVGGMLDAFKEKGAETWGIEIDTSAAKFARSKGHKVVSSIDELIEQGLKADLVIMQDVIEHLTDLTEVQKVLLLLKPKGHLYVWTPGFFRARDPSNLFQLAHTYQFCARSLEFVMTQLGFEEVYEDEDIKSLWKIRSPQAVVFPPPTEWVEYISDVIFKPDEGARKMPRFRGVCKFTPKQLYQNVRENLATRLPDIYEISGTRTGDVIVIGGGPSVDGQVEEIRGLKAKGIPLIVIARMYPWCAKRGIKPDYVLSLDCSEEQEKSFTDIQPGVTYLLASVTRPSLVQKLQGEKCYIFDPKENDKMRLFRAQNGYDAVTVINAGGSVTITALSVGMNLGFTDFHVFGLDLLVQDREQTHAADIAGESVQFDFIEVSVKGEVVLTTPSFLEFANQTLDLISVGHNDGLLKSIQFYGDSLLNYMWDGQFYEEVV